MPGAGLEDSALSSHTAAPQSDHAHPPYLGVLECRFLENQEVDVPSHWSWALVVTHGSGCQFPKGRRGRTPPRALPGTLPAHACLERRGGTRVTVGCRASESKLTVRTHVGLTPGTVTSGQESTFNAVGLLRTLHVKHNRVALEDKSWILKQTRTGEPHTTNT